MTALGMAATARRYERPHNAPGLDERAMRALLRGMKPRDVAECYGVNLRTAFRWRRDLVAVELVSVDGWTATFARRRGKPPVRVTEWEHAA